MRGDSEDMRLVYGDVFDPEEAAAKQAGVRNHITRPVKAAAESSFGWDDDDLDEPIGPDAVRRRLGSRAEGVPQARILRKRPKSKSGD